MKKTKINLLIAFVLIAFASCTTVDSGHKGVEVSWGGETNLEKVYPEGIQYGLNWLVDDLVLYDVREHTMVKKYTFNDMKDMKVDVTLALDYNLDPNQVNLLHSKINDINLKIETSLASAAKEVVPQFIAVDLNKHGRATAEKMLDSLLMREMPEFYVQYKRVRVTDVDIPQAVSDLAEQTAVQIGKNELASKKELEQVNLAKANIAKADGDYQVAILDAKTKDILSQPKMLELKRVENESLMWEGFIKHGTSPFGSNNVFGDLPTIFKNIK